MSKSLPDRPLRPATLLVRGGTLPVVLAFQQVADPAPGKNRLHLDLSAPALDAEVARLTAAGATVVGDRGDESFRWVTLADPQGNEFCVSSDADAEESLGE